MLNIRKIQYRIRLGVSQQEATRGSFLTSDMSKSLGEVCSTYGKRNIEYVLGVLSRRQLEVKFDFQLGLRI